MGVSGIKMWEVRGRVQVRVPRSPKFSDVATYEFDGRYKRKSQCWSFRIRYREQVLALIQDCYKEEANGAGVEGPKG